jgi:hypothetical protein
MTARLTAAMHPTANQRAFHPRDSDAWFGVSRLSIYYLV